MQYEFSRLFRTAGWIFLCTIFLSSCISSQGASEFEYYRTATLKLEETSNLILDQHAVQERALFLQPEAKGISLKFNPDLAGYYTDTIDPPATRAFRKAFHTVVAYNDLLYGLLSGQTAETLTAKIGALDSSFSDAIQSTEILSVPTLPERVALSTGLKVAFTQARPLVKTAFAYQSRRNFREYLIRYYPATRNLLIGLRQSTSDMFNILNASALNRIRASATGQPSKDDLEHILAYRRLLANWVVLIDAAIDGLDASKQSIEAPSTAMDVVESLSAAAADLNAASLAARRDLAAMAAK